MSHLCRTLLIAGAVMAMAFAPAAQAQYYKDRTITLIVGFSPGGGVDTAARVLSQYLGKYVAGNPKVIVKNLTGGASIKAHNFVFEKARGDGETIFFGPWFPVSQITNSPGIRFKYQDFTLLGAVRAAGNILYARADLLGGSKDPIAVIKRGRLKIAGSHPTNSLDIHARLGLELLGVKYDYVRGYRGSAKIRAAVLNGEVEAGMDSIRGYLGAIVPAMVKTGKAIPLWTFPFRNAQGKYVENPSSPAGVPSVLKLYRQVHGKEPSGDRWEGLKFVVNMYGTASHMFLGPPKLNKAAAAAFTKGLYATFKDADYHAAAVKRFKLVPAPVSIETASSLLASLKNMDPKVRAFMNAHVKSGLK